jgi:hypothetical protein
MPFLPSRVLRDVCDSAVAEVVEWQTRTFEGRVAKAVRVQVPPSAPSFPVFPTHYSTKCSRPFRSRLSFAQVGHYCPLGLNY